MSGAQIQRHSAPPVNHSDWNPLPPGQTPLNIVLLCLELALGKNPESRRPQISLTVVDFASLGPTATDKTCPICWEQYSFTSSSPGATIRIMDVPLRIHCGHVIGEDCLREWGCRRNTCTVCRARIRPRFPEALRGLGKDSMTREIMDAFRECAIGYLATRPVRTTYAEFNAWAHLGLVDAMVRTVVDVARREARLAINRLNVLLVNGDLYRLPLW